MTPGKMAPERKLGIENARRGCEEDRVGQNVSDVRRSDWRTVGGDLQWVSKG